MYKLVLFDLDGTLVDSLGDLADSMNAVLEAAGYPTHPRASYRMFVGDGIVNLVRRALPEAAVTDGRVEEFVALMKEEYGRRWLDSTLPFPGIMDLLQLLRERGVKTAILSNKPDGATQEVVRQLFSDHPFDVVRGARRGLPLKPDPTGAFEVADSCGVVPAECAYVGDTDTDMQTGQNAGMFTVGVTWGFRDAVELEASGAQLVVENASDLISVCLGDGTNSG